MDKLVTFLFTDFVSPGIIFLSGLVILYFVRSRRRDSYTKLQRALMRIVSIAMMFLGLVLIVQTFLHRH